MVFIHPLKSLVSTASCNPGLGGVTPPSPSSLPVNSPPTNRTPVGRAARFAGFGLFLTGFDPAHSHKDFPVHKWINSLRGRALLRKRDWRMIISSSGNAAYAIAEATKPFAKNGSRLIVVMDILSSHEMEVRLRKDFDHVEIRLIDCPDSTGSHTAARQREVEALRKQYPDAVVIDQYGRTDCIASFWPGYERMFEQMEKWYPNLGCIILPMGTGASIRSAVAYKLAHRRRWKLIGVDALGSGLTGDPHGARNFAGFGNARMTLWLAQAFPHLDLVAKVDDNATVVASQLLAQAGFHVGASSAAAFAAALSLRADGLLPHRGETVVLQPDHGSLYRSNLFDPHFLNQHGLALAA